MAQSDYIEDVRLWLQAIDMRNLTSRTYKEVLAERVYAFAHSFHPSLEKLVAVLENK